MEGRRERVSITGSRKYPDKSFVYQYIQTLHPNTVIVSGRAGGVDLWARNMAIDRMMNVVDIPALWNEHGRGAGFRRNKIIIEIADRCVVFWDGKSRGTAHFLNEAYKYGSDVKVFDSKGRSRSVLICMPKVYAVLKKREIPE